MTCRAIARLVKRFAGIAACLLVCLSASAAFADIKAYNDAIARNDYVAAAAAAHETWPTLDMQRSDIAVIAREFAWAALLSNQPEQAKTYTGFLIASGAGLSPPDEQPLVSHILDAWADFRIKDNRATRQAFADALAARVNSGGTGLISIVAATRFHQRLFEDGRWNEVKQIAGYSAQLAERGGLAFLGNQRSAETVAIAADFLRSKPRDAYTAMVAMDGRLYNDATNPTNADLKDELYQLHDQAWAWRIAMESHFTSERGSFRPIAAQHGGGQGSDETASPRFAQPAGGQRLCRGQRLNGREIKYPKAAQFGGTVGALIVDLGFNDNGVAVEPKIVAAVPLQVFAPAALEGARTWTFQVDPTEDRTVCQVQRDHYIVIVQFLL